LSQKNRKDRRTLRQVSFGFSTDPTNYFAVPGSSYFGPFNCDEIVDGSDNPAWRSVVRAHGNATNPVTATRVKKLRSSGSASQRLFVITNVSGNWSVAYSQGGSASGACGALPPISYGTADSAALNRARSAFVSEVYSLRGGFQSGIFAGELRETVNLIRHPFKALRDGLSDYHRDLTKGRSRAGKTVRKRTSFLRKTWLEYQFGLSPLIADIKNGYDALQKLNNPSNNPIIRIRKRASGHNVIWDTGGGNYGWAGGSIGFGCRRSYTDDTDAYAYGAYYRQTLEGTSSLADVAGGGFFNFLPTVWELIPYSFLVDYFAPVGAMIEAMSVATLRPLYLGESTVVRRTVRCTDYQYTLFNTPVSTTPNNPHGGQSQTLDPGEHTWVSEKLSRTRPSSIFPTFSVSINGVWGNTRRGLNMLALLPDFKKLQPF